MLLSQHDGKRWFNLTNISSCRRHFTPSRRRHFTPSHLHAEGTSYQIMNISLKSKIMLQHIAGLIEVDKYKVLETDELINQSAVDVGVIDATLPAIFEELGERGAVILKFFSQNEWCLSITEKGKKLAQSIELERINVPRETFVLTDGGVVENNQLAVAPKGAKKHISRTKIAIIAFCAGLLGGGAMAVALHFMLRLI